MAMEKGLLPSGINVNDPTYSSNQQLIHICRTLLSEIEKKSRLQMDLQQAYRGGRVSTKVIESILCDKLIRVAQISLGIQ